MKPITRPTDPDALRDAVRDGYAKVAREQTSCCGPAPTNCCGPAPSPTEQMSKAVGYDDSQLDAIPEDANLGLGCGNPTAIAAIEPGQTVLDLGAGAGIDVFLAAERVGPDGKVIGVDMTDEMLALARENASKGGYDNVEFRKGLIEALPVDDDSVDVILSNCVINLSPEKGRVFAEAHRVLRPGGRLQVSDIVLMRPLPEHVLSSLEAYVGCVAGAVLVDEYRSAIAEAGFRDIEMVNKGAYGSLVDADDERIQEFVGRFGITVEQVRGFADAIVSMAITAVK